MIQAYLNSDKRFLAPEVVQTSAMDCGPAALKCLLEGHGISVSYGRLREACQTSVDGTSIDTLEDVAVQLGLEASQIMLPTDHLLLSESQSLPALVVTRQPNGLTHFVVVWNLVGPFIQIMDPATGRRWATRQRFLDEVYVHAQPLPAEAWRDWVSSEGFTNPLRERFSHLKIEPEVINPLIETALEDSSWFSFGVLDAATRMVEAMVRAKGMEAGDEAGRAIAVFFQQALANPNTAFGIIPAPYWSVQPVPPEPEQPPLVFFRGAVLVTISGLRDVHTTEEAEPVEPLSSELVAALAEAPPQPLWKIFKMLREDGYLVPSILVPALGMATLGIVVEALLLRGILSAGLSLTTVGQRVSAMLALFGFFTLLLLLEFPIHSSILRLGRKLETRLRIAFLEKIPRLGDRYFHSRLTSDMTQRAYELRQIRSLPSLASSFLRLLFQIVLTSIGVILFAPHSIWIALLATVSAIGLSFAIQPMLHERDMRFRTHTGALSRFYLDALLGLVPLRTHGAERSFRREHEMLLVEWQRAGTDFFRYDILIAGIQAVVGTLFSIWILFNYVARGGETSGVLLLFYWTLSLPALGQSLAGLAEQYPILRNQLLRLLEPLGAPDESEIRATELGTEINEKPLPIKTPEKSGKGIHITMDNVTVQAGGHTILSDIALNIQAGEHMAVVGSSGAGKSSLVGLLLGWYWPASGQVWVDGELLSGECLQSLRYETAWVDPAVQIWNRSLLENLQYGRSDIHSTSLTEAIEQANLFSVLEKLPKGLQTKLGEGGGLVSGGEGQRVRLGRAILRKPIRLVILDEPFRGLDRPQRHELLQQARQQWQEATLIFISHDVGDTLDFPRVVVIEEGTIVEDGQPEELSQQDGTRYQALLQAEKAVRENLWSNANWRRLWLEKGKLDTLS